jgi:hypothetical protein
MRAGLSLFALLIVLLIPFSAKGQTVRTETSKAADGRILIDFYFDWSSSLVEFVDSSGVQAWSDYAVEAVTGGFRLAYTTQELPFYATPSVRVVQRQFDEVAVQAKPGEAEQREAWFDGLGWYRKKPVVEVVVPAFQVDTEQDVLRRFRHLQVELVPGLAGSGFSPALSGKNGAAKSGSIVTSALASGQIFRLSITESGVYRINRSFLTSLGLNPDSIDPNTIAVYSNGGRPLEALNGKDRIRDLAVQPSVQTGGGDGNFGASDEVLFYADGPSGWKYDNGVYEHYIHPYSNDNAVFISIGGAAGAALDSRTFTAGASMPQFATTTGRHFVDIEERVWSREHGSGSDWMSNTIRSGGSRDILSGAQLPGLLGGVINYEARVAIASNPRATVAMISGGETLAQRTAPQATTQRSEDPSAVATTFSFQQAVTNGQPLSLRMALLNQANEPEASLDWLRVTYEQDLVRSGEPLAFTTRPNLQGPQEYQFRGFAQAPTVWDITDGRLNWAYTAGTVSGGHAIQVPAADVLQRPRDLIAFIDQDVKSLTAAQSTPVANQNLHGLTGFPDLVIVSPPSLLAAAERLGAHRRNDNLDVVVVTQQQVFNEFSGGVPDMRAVRDYMKFLYDKAPSDRLPKYLLLFGDGHYDFRGKSALQKPQANLIFPYETEESLITDATFTSDDYFGLLDDNEGLWTYTTFTEVSNERVDIGIGRFPAQTLSEAEMMVDKVISYENPSTFGPWRTRYTVVADDGPTGLSGTQNDWDLHLANVDQVAELVAMSLYPKINLNKIYAETFERVFLNGFRIPDAKREISAALNRGTLLLNYSGHGGPNGLAQEEIFTKEDALALTNKDKLAVFVTATCSFGWWDLDETQSGAEALLLNPNGGAVAMMTTVRLVYTSGGTTTLNAGLNRALNISMFEMDQDGLPKRLGDILAETKNTTVGLQGNSRKFNLLGDPSMRIGLPAGNAVVAQLNETPLDTQSGQMKALDLVKIAGEVQTSAGTTHTGFNGKVDVSVFDAERKVPLLVRFYNPTDYFRQREDLLWRGEVQAVNGKFQAEFVVPKDISYSNESGRIAVYARDSDFQAIGYSENFIVGGTSANPPNDVSGPQIRLFLNDTTFVAGQTIQEDPELIVQLYDASGINTVGTGVGHEMLLSVNGDDSGAKDIGSAFTAEPNSFQRGTVRWPLSGLEPGANTLSVRAWDVLNNSNSAELSFNVANDEVLNVINVYNYPNPMSRETRFVFEHNQPPGTSAEVQIRIFTLSGRPIRTIRSEEALPSGVLGSGPLQVFWDGKDDDLDRPATGIYLYRLRVVTTGSDGERQVSEHVEKLAIIR